MTDLTASTADHTYSHGRLALLRQPLRALNPGRFMRGGRVSDAGRLPRYALLFSVACAAIWTPITAYVSLTPPSFTSNVSLILPGSGPSSSVNLADLGQASSSASSAFASSRVSPTVTYKRLLTANRVLESAADAVSLDLWALGEPQIKLVDETSLIHFSIKGPSPEDAQQRAGAVLSAFLSELNALREDELTHRESVSRAAIDQYGAHVEEIRAEIEEVQGESGLLSHAHYEALTSSHDRQKETIETLEAELRDADAATADLAHRLGTDANLAAVTLRLHADPEFQELVTAVSEAAALFADKRGRYGPKHPQVTSAERARDGALERLKGRALIVTGQELDALSDRVDLAPDPSRSGLLADLVDQAKRCEGLRARLASLTAQATETEAELNRLAPAAARLDDLSRDYQVAEAVFASALARTDTSRAEVYASYPLVQVLEDASLPEEPSSPKIKIALAAGVVACFMVLMGLALAWMRRPLIDTLLKDKS